MRDSENKALQEKRETIASKVAEFLAGGGEIQQVPRGESGHKLVVMKDKTGRQRWVDPKQQKRHITVEKRKAKRHRR